MKPIAIVLAALLILAGGCTNRRVEIVESFRAARSDGDLDAARGYLAPDPRVWYDSREGEGSEWKLGGGRWKAWDTEFNSTSEPGPWRVESTPDGETVWRIVEEWNDYFRLIERDTTPRYRITYFFEGDRIKGYMISAADPGASAPPTNTRLDEIEAWARENHAEEWEYLRPGGSPDPTGDRAERTRTLINEWRVLNGLDAIE